MNHSIDNVRGLPSVDETREVSQSLAVLDIVLMQDWEYRYFSFNARWDSEEMIASMRNGEGDEYFLLFCKAGTIGKIYSVDEEVLDTDTVLQKVPAGFDAFVTEPAFNLKRMTCCIWREYSGDYWRIVPALRRVPLLRFLVEREVHYHRWAKEYYGKDLDLNTIRKFFEHHPLHPDLIRQLNNKVSFEDIEEEVLETGYPVST